MIRRASMEDVSGLVAFCFECERSMRWNSFGLSGDKASVQDTLKRLVSSDMADLSVVELDGDISGACAVALQGFAWNERISIASEMIWHMRPSFPPGPAKNRWFLRMLDHMSAWAASHGASLFKINTVWGDAPLGSALSRRGFSAFETVFLQGVSHGG